MSLYATTIVTEDVPGMRAFYEELLGVEAVGGPVYCELRAPGGWLALVDKHVHPAAEDVGTAENRSVELTIAVPDIDAEYVRLGSLVKQWLGPPSDRFFEWRTAMFRDPDGNLVSIGTPAPWAINTEVRDWDRRMTEVLRRQVEDAAWFMRNAVRGLTDDEYMRELAPGSWSIRRRADAKTPLAAGAGEWVIDYASTSGSPAPFTTIAWRLVHIGLVTWNTMRHVIGEKGIGWDELDPPRTAADASHWLADGAGRLCVALHDVRDQDLRDRIDDGLTAYDALVRMIRESVHHAAEIACLRDVYRALG